MKKVQSIAITVLGVLTITLGAMGANFYTQVLEKDEVHKENEEKLVSLNETINRLNQENDQLSEKIRKGKETSAQVIEFKNLVQMKEEEIGRAKKQILALQKKQVDLMAGHLTKDGAIAKLEKEVETSKSQIPPLELKLQMHQEELERLQERTLELQKTKDEEIEKAKLFIAQLEDSNKGKDKELSDAEARILELQEAQKELLDQLPSRNKAVTHSEEQAKTVELKPEQTPKSTDSPETGISEHQKENETGSDNTVTRVTVPPNVNQTDADLQKQVMILKQELEKAHERAEDLEKQISELWKENEELAGNTKMRIATLEKAIGEKDQELSGAKNKIRELQESQGNLKAQLAAKTNSLSQFGESQLNELKTTCDSLVSELKTNVHKKEVAIQKLQEKLSVTFVDRVLFRRGQVTITPNGRKALKKVANVLKNVNESEIRVIGHADNIPISASFAKRYPTNWELSASRATAVVRYLQKMDVDPKILEAVGRSFYQPIATHDTVEGRAKNRRVEIIIAPQSALENPPTSVEN